MKLELDLLSQIPTVTWQIPKEKAINLKSFFNIWEAESYNLLLLSLTHKSYLNEVLSEESASIASSFLDFLESIGKDIVNFGAFSLIFSKNSEISKNDMYISSQALKAKIVDELPSILQISHFYLIGKGEKISISGNCKKVDSICFQLIAGLVLLQGLNEILNLFDKHFNSKNGEEDLNRLEGISPKMFLQEYSQKTYKILPSYQLISKCGPAHEPEFCIEVRIKGNTILATGPSKKKAESKAAELFLRKYAQHFLLESGILHKQQCRGNAQNCAIIPREHSLGVDDLTDSFNLTNKGKLLLSRSLVHKSYINENKKHPISGFSGALVQIGSALINCIAGVNALKIYLNQGMNVFLNSPPALIKALVEKNILDLFDKLHVEPLILRGKGESQNELVDSIKIGTVKSILASIFIDKGNLEIPIFVNWLEEILNKISITQETTFDSKSYLQEFLQAMGELAWKYEYNKEGPSHKTEFTASLIFSSLVLNEKLKYIARKAYSSKKYSDKGLSKSVLSIIDVLNGNNFESNYDWDNWFKILL